VNAGIMTNDQVHPEQMLALDALMFRGDEHARSLSVVGGLFLFDGPLQRRQVAQAVARAAETFPRLRQRAVVPAVRLALPHWTDDPDFDAEDHVLERRVTAPGSLAEVLDAIRPELAAPLVDDRPLWEALLLTGLADGRGALFFKMSHAMTDGQGALRLFDALFAAGAASMRRRPRLERTANFADPTTSRAQALSRLPMQMLAGAAGLLPDLIAVARDALQDPAAFAGSAEKYLASIKRVLNPPCPPAPVLATRSLERRCAVLTLSLPRLKRAARANHASINDLYLAAVTSALRRYQMAMGVDPQDVPLAVPVDLRAGDEDAAGNYIGALNLVAPASEPDPARRLAALHAAMAAGRSEPAIAAPALIAPLLARMPDIAFERLIARIPRADVQASNVRGPTVRPVLAGRRVLALFPFGPVPGVGAMIAMLSLADECFVAVHFDAASFAAPETFAECLREGFGEVLAAGGESGSIATVVLDHGSSRRRPAAGRRDRRDRAVETDVPAARVAARKPRSHRKAR
jgi:diacylglycerol O-acyltransferase